jgi:hypothetical protein
MLILLVFWEGLFNLFEIDEGRTFSLTAKSKNLNPILHHFLELKMNCSS